MACRTEVANEYVYDYCPDDLPPIADRVQALVQGRFVDELTGLGMTANLLLATNVTDLWPRVAFNGIAGLVGNPARRFPGLDMNTVTIDMSVAANRYITRAFSEDLGPFNTGMGAPADYPRFFAPIDLGDVGLHRQATLIKGRIAQNNGGSRVPLAGVTVEIIGVWHPFPAVDEDPTMVMEAANIVALTQALYRDRIAGTDQIHARPLTPALGDEKQLLLAAAAGATQLRISDQVNLNNNDLLAIDLGHGDLIEYIQVTNIVGASTDDQPATVTLAYPLNKEHREGVTVVRVQPQVAATNNNLSRDGHSGDQTLFLDALTDIASGTTVEITDGISVPEYHVASLYQVLSDADGFYRLPPLARVAQAQIRASRADLPAPAVSTYSPDYDLAENRLDLIFG